MYPSKPLLITWGGQIGQYAEGADVWQCGLHLGHLDSAADPDIPSAEELALLYTTVVQPYHGAPMTKIAPAAVLTWCKAVVLTTSGKYATEPINYAGVPQFGGGPADSGAPQLSSVVTLWSGQSLGKGNYGRYYLPWCAEAPSRMTGRISGTARDELALRSHTFLEAVNAWGAGSVGGCEVLLYGATGGGTKKRPKFVKVGDVLDTQRRRRNRIKESYAAVELTA